MKRIVVTVLMAGALLLSAGEATLAGGKIDPGGYGDVVGQAAAGGKLDPGGYGD